MKNLLKLFVIFTFILTGCYGWTMTNEVFTYMPSDNIYNWNYESRKDSDHAIENRIKETYKLNYDFNILFEEYFYYYTDIESENAWIFEFKLSKFSAKVYNEAKNDSQGYYIDVFGNFFCVTNTEKFFDVFKDKFSFKDYK